MTLTWKAISGATSYNLYYAAGSTVTTATGTKVSDITTTSKTVSGLSNNVNYAFILTAVDGSGESASGAVFTETPPYFGSDVPNYPVDGHVTTNIDSDVPSWIKDNFTNVRAYMSGTNIVIESRGLPPYKSYYYGKSTSFASLNDSSYTPSFPDPNVIKEQAITFTISQNPTISPSTVTSGLGPVGLAKNGVIIFNAVANPPDYIQDEGYSFDAYGGHPQATGIYHYHSEPAGFKTAAGDELIGLAMDGFPIYGPKSSSGTTVFDAGGNSSAATTTWSVNNTNWVANTADTALTSLPHYHVVDNYYLATVNYNPGTITELQYMIGTYLGGAKGTMTNTAP